MVNRRPRSPLLRLTEGGISKGPDIGTFEIQKYAQCTILNRFFAEAHRSDRMLSLLESVSFSTLKVSEYAPFQSLFQLQATRSFDLRLGRALIAIQTGVWCPSSFTSRQ